MPPDRRSFGNFELLEQRRLLALNPSAIEQELLQLTNRFRSDPAGEYSRLIASTAPLKSFNDEVTNNIVFSNLNASMFQQEMKALKPVPPLAWNEIAQNLATTQNQTMISKKSQEHFPNLSQTLWNLGVPLEGGSLQNAFWNNVGVGKVPYVIYAAYVIDWIGNLPGGSGGMQPDRPHRANLISADHNQIASALTPGTALTSTQFIIKVNSGEKMAVGAIFEDKNKSGWYEAGEGIGGAQIAFRGAAGVFTTTSMTAGGYQIALPPGTYSMTATGGGMKQIVNSTVVVGDANVWRNLIYDPVSVGLDAREPNNSLPTASELTGRDQTLESLTIHSGDLDYFKFVSPSTGSAKFDLRFTNANGNLDLRVLDSVGRTLASSITTADTESITINLVRGSVYYVQVFSNSNASNNAYVLQVNLPEPVPPVAVKDRGMMELAGTTLVISILGNDSDPDGSSTGLVPTILSSSGGAFVVNSNRTVTFTPQTSFTGTAIATYRVSDDQGLLSATAVIEVFVLNFSRESPWQNPVNRFDVNEDRMITPLDASILIDEVRNRGTRPLQKSISQNSEVRAFVDVNGSGSVEPTDILFVIQELIRSRPVTLGGRGEGESSAPPQTTRFDLAVLQLAGDDTWTLARRRKA